MNKQYSLDSLFEKIVQEPARLAHCVFSSPVHSKIVYHKIVFRPVQLKTGLYCQVTSFTKTQCFTSNISFESILDALQKIKEEYTQLSLRFVDEVFHVLLRAGKKPHIKHTYLLEKATPDHAHNRKKQHLISEGEPVECLIELGVMTKEGKIKPEMRDKFLQINRFLEQIHDLIEKTAASDTFEIVDFGCGKAYLTFALYYLFAVKKKKSMHIVGIDLKKEVMQYCQDLAKKLGFTGLEFVNQPIKDYVPKSKIDLCISLHACDIATDAAIAKSVIWRAKALAVAPCCQHELSQQVNPASFPILFKHGLFKERFSALLTDAFRVQILELMGYTTDVCEFIDPQHTPKNLLIRAVLKGKKASPNDWKTYHEMTKKFGVFLSLEKFLEMAGFTEEAL